MSKAIAAPDGRKVAGDPGRIGMSLFYRWNFCRTDHFRSMEYLGNFQPLSNLSAALAVLAALNSTIEPAHAYDASRLVAAEAKRQGVPVSFALRVARVESGVQCQRHNKSGASGPLQIIPASARALGFRGHIRSASCAVQTHYGMRHLAMCYRGARGNQRVAAACHYQGISALRRVSRAGAAYARKVAQ